MDSKLIKKRVQPYKKDNTYRNIKKGAIATGILIALGGSLYRIQKIKKNDKTEVKKQTKK
mgnify:CR=1 FL=1